MLQEENRGMSGQNQNSLHWRHILFTQDEALGIVRQDTQKEVNNASFVIQLSRSEKATIIRVRDESSKLHISFPLQDVPGPD